MAINPVVVREADEVVNPALDGSFGNEPQPAFAPANPAVSDTHDVVKENLEAFVESSLELFIQKHKEVNAELSEADLQLLAGRFKKQADILAETQIVDVDEQVFCDIDREDAEKFWADGYEILKSKDDKNFDSSGVGVVTTKDFEQYDIVFQDFPVLKHHVDNEGPWTLEACEPWFWEKCNAKQRRQVLDLKWQPNYDAEDAAVANGHPPLGKLDFYLRKASDILGISGIDNKVSGKDSIEERDQIIDVLMGASVGDQDEVCDKIKILQLIKDDSEFDGQLQAFAKAHKMHKHLITLRAYSTVRTNGIRDGTHLMLFPILSRVNHGCDPNLWQQNGVIMALRDIKAGEELAWCYPQGRVADEWTEKARHYLFMNTKERNDYLREFYDFSCKCGRCCAKNEDEGVLPREEVLPKLQELFQKITYFVETVSNDAADEERWQKVIEQIDEFSNLWTENHLDLDIKLQGQLSTVATVYQSMRLKMIAFTDSNSDGNSPIASNQGTDDVMNLAAVSCTAKQAEIKNDIRIFEESLHRELKYNILGYGIEGENVKLLQRNLAMLNYGKLLRQYASRK